MYGKLIITNKENCERKKEGKNENGKIHTKINNHKETKILKYRRKKGKYL